MSDVRSNGIWINPARMGGAPCVDGTRVPVSSIVALFKRGLSIASVVELYSHAKVDSAAVENALRYVLNPKARR